MDTKEQIQKFAGDLDKFIDQYRNDWSLPVPAITGCLNMKITMLELEAIDNDKEEE